jgi:hypothetical protein
LDNTAIQENHPVSPTTKPAIDVDQLLIKVKIDHLWRSKKPETYPEAERERNLRVIDKLEFLIKAFYIVRSGMAEEVMEVIQKRRNTRNE